LQRRSDPDNGRVPAELLRPTPRHVRPNAFGVLAMVAALALVAAGLWGGADLYRKAKESQRRVQLFATESATADAVVVRVQRRGGDDDRRSIVHYRYAAADNEYTGIVTMRRADHDRYSAGSTVSVRYLASEPGASWIEGRTPRVRPLWPAFATPLACVAAACAVFVVIRRQSHLLAYGRPAAGVVSKVEKKKGDKGSYWRVHYEWSVLSGAKREGGYNHLRKNPPAVGTVVPIVYDRDTEKSARYPFSMVTISDSN
jgi:Protein of unknown function (DUF3592)